jgi:hypothetical protein
MNPMAVEEGDFITNHNRFNKFSIIFAPLSQRVNRFESISYQGFCIGLCYMTLQTKVTTWRYIR